MIYTAYIKAERHKAEQKYYLIQKFMGMLLIVLGLITIPLCNGDITYFVVITCLGIGLIVTKDKVLRL